MLLLNSHDNMAQPGRLITVGQLFTVSPEPRPPHLLLVDDLHNDPHLRGEDLLSGPLSSLDLQLQPGVLTRSKAGPGTPFLSCSSQISSTRAAGRSRRTAKEVSERDNSLIVGDFALGPPLAQVDPAPLAPKERKLRG